MNDNVKSHPYQAAMADAKLERAVADSPEGQALVEAIFSAVNAYVSYLDQHGLFFQDDPEDPSGDPITKSEALVITAYPFFGTDITLKNGPIDRVYGNGVDPTWMDAILSFPLTSLGTTGPDETRVRPTWPAAYL